MNNDKPQVQDGTMSHYFDLIDASAPLKRRTLLAYGLGDTGTGMASALVGFYLFVFYTDVVGLSAWLAGTVLMLVRLWDILSDQLIGWMSDRTHGLRGPRIPWMLTSAFPLGLSMALLWWAPPLAEPWTFVWLLLIASLFQATYSGVNLPYSALATELTDNVELRTHLNSLRFTGSVLASLAGLILGSVLSDRGASGYGLMGCIAGILLTTSGLASAIGLSPAAAVCQRPNPDQPPFVKQLGWLCRNGLFLRVVMMYLLLWGALSLMQPVAIIYLSDLLHLPHSWSTGLLIPFQVSALVGLWIWNRISKRYSRLRALQIGGSAWILLSLIAMVLPALPIANHALAAGNRIELSVLMMTLVLLGISAATAYLLPWSFLPDVVDSSPGHPAGVITASMVQIQKLGSAASVFVLGELLSWSGYKAGLGEHQPDMALTMIRMSMGLFPALMVLSCLWVMRDWNQIREQYMEGPPV